MWQGKVGGNSVLKSVEQFGGEKGKMRERKKIKEKMSEKLYLLSRF